jgi:hypothetical protein
MIGAFLVTAAGVRLVDGPWLHAIALGSAAALLGVGMGWVVSRAVADSA